MRRETAKERAGRIKKLTARANQLQARYGGILKQALMALDNVGNGDIPDFVETGCFSISEVRAPMVFKEDGTGDLLVCCGGVSRRRRGSAFALLIKRTKGITTPLGLQDATSCLLPAEIREDPSGSVPAAKVRKRVSGDLPK